MAVSDLEPERLRPLLRGGLGEPYLYVAETPSTQELLRDGDYAHGAVAVAEHQTAGRGRSGRRWDDAPSTALLLSVLLRPPAAAALPQLSLIVGLAVAEAIERESDVHALVKWPNDVLIAGSKVAGILLEASDGDVVCGIGINVNQMEHDLPPVTRTAATSLRLAIGRPFDRGTLLASLLISLERRYADWLNGGLDLVSDELERRNALRGQNVRVAGRVGTAGSIAPDGRLTIVLERGDTVLVESGEVEIV
jgi:BirA family transcriptional regulator, biotin operon repressor / biotin---[acetyl-CoA-carboxylase] ligase